MLKEKDIQDDPELLLGEEIDDSQFLGNAQFNRKDYDEEDEEEDDDEDGMIELEEDQINDLDKFFDGDNYESADDVLIELPEEKKTDDNKKKAGRPKKEEKKEEVPYDVEEMDQEPIEEKKIEIEETDEDDLFTEKSVDIVKEEKKEEVNPVKTKIEEKPKVEKKSKEKKPEPQDTIPHLKHWNTPVEETNTKHFGILAQELTEDVKEAVVSGIVKEMRQEIDHKSLGQREVDEKKVEELMEKFNYHYTQLLKYQRELNSLDYERQFTVTITST